VIAQERRRIVVVSAAEREIAVAAGWYEKHKPGLGEPFLQAVRDAALAAAAAPSLYAKVHSDLRRVLVRRFPYALIVREHVTEFIVIACVHLRRDPRIWQRRA